MYRPKLFWALTVLMPVSPSLLLAQGGPPPLHVEYQKGITIRTDSSFSMQVRFRMQNRIGFTTIAGDDLSAASTDMRIRRMRLRLEGHVLTKRLKYYLQLNFSRADLDLEDGVVAQPLRDAMVFYDVTKWFTLGVGQTKLPGNRQRMVSSGSLQFPDRSIANGVFTLDRDMGVFGTAKFPMAGQELQLKGAITSGEGRGPVVGSNGLCYTGRVEYLPFGPFTNGGDYFEGDLEMEPKPKLSLGAAYGYNDAAVRSGGQLGSELYAPKDMATFIVDMVYKQRGWALSAEFFDRQCSAPITMNTAGTIHYVTTGQGVNMQLSKYFRSKYEIASRYTLVRPSGEVAALRHRTEEALLGASRYVNHHKIKLQAYLGYRWTLGNAAFDHSGNAWTTMFQIEFGI